MISNTAIRAIEAYGGEALWKNSNYIEAEVSVTGLLFALKGRPYFDHAHIRLDIGKPLSRLTPIGKNKNITGVLEGFDVRLEKENGEVVSTRTNAREYFPYGRRLLYWDDLDMSYFANYAFWNYFTMPRLLMNPNMEWTEQKPGCLQAVFPESLPTHCPVQEYFFEIDTGKLLQHNYTASVVSGLATAAHVVTEHDKHDGLIFPSRRIITPRTKRGAAMKKPVLVDIRVHRFKLL